MKASLEISMYPLDKSYEGPILDFIERLNGHPELSVRTNTMSTQIFGEYDALMAAVTKEMKRTFEDEPSVAMVMKVINSDLEE
jgi:uncharacterized protein YqgV (UPF0045/DUF77 family)